MADVVKVQIEGLRETMDALRSMLPDRTARAVMTRVLQKRAKPLAAHASALAPRRTGMLGKRIIVTKQLARSQRSAYRKTDPNDVTIFVGTGAVPYAHLVEFGSSKSPPQPFLRPAWDAAQQQILSGISRDMWDEIKKSVERAARKAAKAKK